MNINLSIQNVGDYLVTQNLCQPEEVNLLQVKNLSAKNFNLLVTFPDNRKLLVKQRRYNPDRKIETEFAQEAKIQAFLRQFPPIEQIAHFFPQLLHFDPANSVIIFNYLDDYQDLSDFYSQNQEFEPKISQQVGQILGKIHSLTFQKNLYQEYFHPPDSSSNKPRHIDPERFTIITPEIYGEVTLDEIKFLSLYQRYDSLSKAVTELSNRLSYSCLAHNDCKLSNILIPHNWQTNDNMIFIDWEKSFWGDPALDLGMLIASYLILWLDSLVVSSAIPIQESLRLATIPLELLPKSIASLTLGYLQQFPLILQENPDFLSLVTQCTGFTLVKRVRIRIQHQKILSNNGIAMLQVGKSLLCKTEDSIPNIFGMTADQLIDQLN
ncbi:hypothetical protein BCD67_03075 [Oscillatoriales cyanobacterium USR001]|nr:hypothetical protein BCD67_03075 [Oscillatoriales cyanobacterium USR001]